MNAISQSLINIEAACARIDASNRANALQHLPLALIVDEIRENLDQLRESLNAIGEHGIPAMVQQHQLRAEDQRVMVRVNVIKQDSPRRSGDLYIEVGVDEVNRLAVGTRMTIALLEDLEDK